MRSLAERYAVLLREPGVPRFVALSFVMRMPLGTVGLATLLHVREITGSIAFAGSVVGAMLVAAAAAAPIQGRLIDRHGPLGVLSATGLVAPLALFAILLARPLDLARPGLLAVAVVAGTFAPPVTVIVRTLLRARFAEGALRQSAFALDAVLLELAYTAGPLLIAAAIALHSSMAAMAVVSSPLPSSSMSNTSMPRGLPGSMGHAHGSRCWTCQICASAFSAMVSGSTSTAASRSALGTLTM